MKKERQEAILHLIVAEEISTQEMLREKMAELGFAVTQATLSRDIRELKLTKERRNGRSCYCAPAVEQLSGGIFQEAALRTDYAGNIAVIHCRAGTAQAIGVSLDTSHREDMVGTIAGDDTVFVLMRTEAQAREFALTFVKKMELGGV